MSWPAAWAYGPSCPHPVIRPKTSFGLRAWHSVGPRPSRSITPGRNPSISASADSTRSSSVATPSGCFRSMAMLRRPRSRRSPCGVVGHRPAHRRAALDPDDLGAHVGQHHRGERAGPDAGDLDDPVSARVDRSCQFPTSAGRRTAIRTLPAIASTSTGHSGRGRSWPMSARTAVVTRGSTRPCANPPSGEIRVSSRPWITSVGHVERGEASRPVAARVDRRQLARRALRRRTTGRSRRPPTSGPRPRRSTSSTARPSPAPTPRCTPHVPSAAAPAGRRGPPASGRRPGVAGAAHDRGEAGDAVGCSIAMVCTIIPPIDTPAMCARSMPRWSSRPIPSAAMSDSV